MTKKLDLETPLRKDPRWNQEQQEKEKEDLAVEIWSLFNQLECRISQLAVSDARTVNASWRLREARMWLEQLECDEFVKKNYNLFG